MKVFAKQKSASMMMPLMTDRDESVIRELVRMTRLNQKPLKSATLTDHSLGGRAGFNGLRMRLAFWMTMMMMKTWTMIMMMMTKMMMMT